MELSSCRQTSTTDCVAAGCSLHDHHHDAYCNPAAPSADNATLNDIFNAVQSPEDYGKSPLLPLIHAAQDRLQTVLFNYQLRSVAKMMSIETARAGGGILAENMGSGKTLIVIALIIATLHIPVSLSDGNHWDISMKSTAQTGDQQETVVCSLREGAHFSPKVPVIPCLADLCLLHLKLHSNGSHDLHEFIKDYRSTGTKHLTDSFDSITQYYTIPLMVQNSNSHRRDAVNAVPTITESPPILIAPTTLIIVPDTLAAQWMTEFNKHVLSTTADGPASYLTRLDLVDARTAVPDATRLSKYDIVLMTHSRLALEARGTHNLEVRTEGVKRNRCMCPYVGNSRKIECKCGWSEVVAQDQSSASGWASGSLSPLMRVHFKRIVFDEGHLLKHQSLPTTRLVDVVSKLKSQFRWVCSGTPFPAVFMSADTEEQYKKAADGSPEGARYRKRLKELEHTDLKKLEGIVKFLKIDPFFTSNDKKLFERTIIRPWKQSSPAVSERVQKLFDSIIIRHRLEDINNENELPPLFERRVLLRMSDQERITMNLLIALVQLNSILTERVGVDYLGHVTQRAVLHEFVANLNLAFFFFNGFEILNHAKNSLPTALDALRQTEDGKKNFDVEMLKTIIWHLKQGADETSSYFSLQSRANDNLFSLANDGGCRNCLTNCFLGINGTLYASSEDIIQMRKALKLAMLNADSRTEGPPDSHDSQVPSQYQPQSIHVDDFEVEPPAKKKKVSFEDNPEENSDVSPAIIPPPSVSDPLSSKFCESCRNSLSLDFKSSFGVKISKTVSTKITYLGREILKYHLSEKIIVFTTHDNELFAVKLFCEIAKVKFLTFEARGQKLATKATNVTTFNTSDAIRVIIMDLACASHGLDLSSASRVYFLRPAASRAVYLQAIKRAHRLGCTKPVHVEVLVFQNTLEDENDAVRGQDGGGLQEDNRVDKAKAKEDKVKAQDKAKERMRLKDLKMKELIDAAPFVPVAQESDISFELDFSSFADLINPKVSNNIGRPPPSNAWRKTIVLSSIRSKQRSANVCSIKLPNIERYTTSVVPLEETPFLAVGCASTENNLFIVENTSQPFDEDNYTGILKTRSAFSVPDLIYKMSFSHGFLATAGTSSRVQLFKLDTNEIGNRGKGFQHQSEIRLHPTGNLSDIPVSPPDTRIASVRVQGVDFLPTCGAPPSNVLGIMGHKAYVWDLAAEKMASTEAVSVGQLMCVSCSPHPPYGCLVATGDVDNCLSILDTRLMGFDTEKSVVLRYEKAHAGSNHAALTSVKFNPFVPYWLASAGEDSVVRVWDLRYAKAPAVKIEGHYQGIQSICWSKMHAEILVTGSNDCSARGWSINRDTLEPVKSPASMFIGSPATAWDQNSSSQDVCIGANLIACADSFGGFVVSVDASQHLPNTFYALSNIGELTCLTLTASALESTAPQRDQVQESAGTSGGGSSTSSSAAVEACLRARNIAKAFSLVTDMSRAALAARAPRHAVVASHVEARLLSLCTALPAISPADWTLSPRAGAAGFGEGEPKNVVDKFKTDLETFTAGLPPGFGECTRWYELIPQKTRLEFDMVKQRFKILRDISQKNFETVLSAEESLIVEALLVNDYLSGLKMGRKLLQTVDECAEIEAGGNLTSRQTRFSQLSGTIGILLFPTVFEPAEWLNCVTDSEEKWAVSRGAKMRQLWIKQAQEDQALSPETQKMPILKTQQGQQVNLATVTPATTDNSETPKIKLGAHSSISDPAAVLNMLSTELAITNILNSNAENHEIAEQIIQAASFEAPPAAFDPTKTRLSPSPATAPAAQLAPEAKVSIAGIKLMYKPTISATTNRLYSDALIITNRFDEFFLLAHDFCVSYPLSAFSKNVLRHAEKFGLPKLKAHVESLNSKTLAQISDAVQHPDRALGKQILTGGGAGAGASGQSAAKTIREGITLVVKIAVVMAQLMEAKGVLEKSGIEGLARCVSCVGGLFKTLSNTTFKLLEQMDAMFGRVGASTATRDVISSIQEDMRHVCKNVSKPSEAKTRAIATIISNSTDAGVKDSGSGAALLEEVFAISDRLGTMLKPPQP
ncbi:hypothetical protein HDU82_003135 [Entophlyctis luteolus]|nr:hypothetical protein HDU82_003135 [Entophlyctis luteolus]